MGSHRDRERRRSGPLTRIAQVVPDLATFAVDDGFSYRIPDGLDVSVGSVVRVPLGGRRVRGFVVDVRPERDGTRALKDVAGVTGVIGAFDRKMLETMRWTAVHYVAPLATVLGRALPPNAPRPSPSDPYPPVPSRPSPLPEVSKAAASGSQVRPQYLVGSGPWADAASGLAAAALAAQRSVAVIAPTVAEVAALAADLAVEFGNRVVVATSALPAKHSTAAWGRAATVPGSLLVGTREAAMWPVASLALVLVVEEARRAMKSPQTPTIQVHELLRHRAAVERFSLVFAGPVPSCELVGGGVRIHEPGTRVWRLVEVVDRRQDPDVGAIVTERARSAVRAVTAAGGTGFVLVHHRGYAPAFRCVRCGSVRRCPQCGAAASRDGACRRCGSPIGVCTECGGARFAPLGAGIGRVVDDLRRTVGDAVGPAGEHRPVIVGTERDLAAAAQVDLALMIDADAWLLAPHYRAEEDALRITGRLAGLVARGSGRRCMVQTAIPDHRVLAAARHGHPSPLLHELVAEREQLGFPPSGELLSIELHGAHPDADDKLRALVAGDATVLGPAIDGDTTRWLLQDRDLRPVRVRLRGLVQQWRDADTRVRIDADPV